MTSPTPSRQFDCIDLLEEAGAIRFMRCRFAPTFSRMASVASALEAHPDPAVRTAANEILLHIGALRGRR